MPNAFPTLLPFHTGHYPDQITLQAAGVVPDPNSGEEIHVFADVVDLVDLPCRVTPASLREQMESTERRFGNRTELVEMRRVAIPQYLPQITTAMQAVIDGEAWNVRGAQAEEHVTLTRLLIEQVSL